MNTRTQIGRVIWHDLLTNDIAEALRFYADLFGWTYQIEHATDFAWRLGEEADYPLILADGAAHDGFVEVEEDVSSHWLAWVEDADAAAAMAEVLGATVERAPFDVPGVGRGAVIQDPQGALICPFVPSYRFPCPSGTFVWDEITTGDVESAERFYRELFGWTAYAAEVDKLGRYTVFTRGGGADAAGAAERLPGAAGPAAWVPYLAANDVDGGLSSRRRRAVRACKRKKPTCRTSAGPRSLQTRLERCSASYAPR